MFSLHFATCAFLKCKSSDDLEYNLTFLKEFLHLNGVIFNSRWVFRACELSNPYKPQMLVHSRSCESIRAQWQEHEGQIICGGNKDGRHPTLNLVGVLKYLCVRDYSLEEYYFVTL